MHLSDSKSSRQGFDLKPLGTVTGFGALLHIGPADDTGARHLYRTQGIPEIQGHLLVMCGGIDAPSLADTDKPEPDAD